ncbi:MAG: hypothetical protein JOS17DRAFT_537535 [Linnemannia elongata]|nr:MAG: hypothetical protein JOS17DRAFT_537535 [Linnemannia elongata]
MFEYLSFLVDSGGPVLSCLLPADYFFHFFSFPIPISSLLFLPHFLCFLSLFPIFLPFLPSLYCLLLFLFLYSVVAPFSPSSSSFFFPPRFPFFVFSHLDVLLYIFYHTISVPYPSLVLHPPPPPPSAPSPHSNSIVHIQLNPFPPSFFHSYPRVPLFFHFLFFSLSLFSFFSFSPSLFHSFSRPTPSHSLSLSFPHSPSPSLLSSFLPLPPLAQAHTPTDIQKIIQTQHDDV